MDDRSNDESPATAAGISQGIMRIDGQAATSIKYARSREGDQDQFELTFRMGDTQVAKVKRLTPAELADAVGARNAERMSGPDTVKGTLKGETLDFVDGVTPTERELRQASNTVEKGLAPEHETGLVNTDEALAFARKLRERDRKLWARELSQETSDKAEDHAKRIAGASQPARPAQAADLPASPEDRSTQLPEHEQARRAELIDRLHSQYRVAGSRFYYRDQPDKIAFRDGQTQLKTATNDERVAQAMIARADSLGWKVVNISGHPDFMRPAWMEARLRGIETTGPFKPTPADLEALRAAQEKLMGNRVDRVPDRSQKPAQADGRDTDTHGQGRAAKAAPERAEGRVSTVGDDGKAQGDKAKQMPADGRLSAREVAAVGGVAGKVLAHGPAPYNNDPQEKPSYFVRLATKDGERTVWGKELPDALAKGGATAGDFIKLKHGGDKPVTVEANKRDEQGKVVGTQTIDAARNTWSVTKLDRAAAVLALGEALAEKHLSPESQERLRDAIERRVIASPGKVPAVQVYDKAAPPREVGRERSGMGVDRAPERNR